jgi:hypothetical protein
MKSEDDAEARIRELEQPMVDAARASEAAANQQPTKWAPPPGPPMPPSGPLMPSPPVLPYSDSYASSRTGLLPRGQTRWIMLAVFVIGMMCLPLAIFYFSAHQVSRSGLPSMLPFPSFSSQTAAPSGAMPHTPGAMPRTPGAAPSTSSVATGDNVTVSGISEVRTIACNGGSVSVSGITNNVVITGHCAGVIVSGIQNQVSVDSADKIQASGSQNQITYHTGSPTIGNSGLGNVVHEG